MPFTHHSHSGSFCNHAVDSLSAILAHAHARNFHTFALTEHVPRGPDGLYPGEKDHEESAAPDGRETGVVEILRRKFEAYVAEAKRLRAQYAGVAGAPRVLVGFEAEWISAAESVPLCADLMRRHEMDFFVGSVHHVAKVPIDYDRALYERAREEVGRGEDEGIFEAYFDAQLEMLRALKPLVVGHFDLVRLHSRVPDEDLRRWKGVWERVVRNLKVVKGYGGVLEVNSSGRRKGMVEPYPKAEIVREWVGMGGVLVLSDDSHGIAQVGACFGEVFEFLKGCGVTELGYLSRKADESDERRVEVKKMDLEAIEKLPFWTSKQ